MVILALQVRLLRVDMTYSLAILVIQLYHSFPIPALRLNHVMAAHLY